MKLLTFDEAATPLAVSTIGVRRLVRDGHLEALRPLGGRAVRVVEESVDAYLEGLRSQGREARELLPTE